MARACAWSGTGETVVLRICWMFKHNSSQGPKVEVQGGSTLQKNSEFLTNQTFKEKW